MKNTDLYAALMHEMKNNLGLLAMTIDNVPLTGAPPHDRVVDDARLLCQRVVDRLRQALLIYKAGQENLIPAIDAYSPGELVDELCATARALARERLQIDMHIAENTPDIWFFDRALVEMALVNALHNSLEYAHSRICIRVGMDEHAWLTISVHDDSPGFPEHILRSFADKQPYRSTGTGLGLQFARLIAEAHENGEKTGVLRLHNDAGAVFSLLLP